MSKILVLGSLDGQLEAAFTKVASIHSKNNFALAIATGNLFGADGEDDDSVTRLLNGEIKIPLPTYFTVGTIALPIRIIERIAADEEICENLYFLGKRSTTKTSDGIRIIALGGARDPEVIGGQSKEQHLPFHSDDDAKALKGAHSADILVTAVWPAEIWKNTHKEVAFDKSAILGSDAVADLCAAIRPRYHFSASPSTFFYERDPFYHPPKEASEATNVTRFISMGPFGNKVHAKAMYAFTLSNETAATIPVGTTESPFARPPSRKRAGGDHHYSRFSNGQGDGDYRPRKRQRAPPPGPEQCFFCLSNPNLPTHMVCSVGDDSYLTVAKGPLPASDTFKDQNIGFPGHLLIIPLTHAPTVTAAAMGADAASATFKEMTRFRNTLQSMVATRSKGKLGAVTWEINRGRGIHSHWQFVPVPADQITRGLVEGAFKVEAANMKLPSFETRDFGTGDEIGGDYFRVWIWAEVDGGGPEGEGDRVMGTSLVMRFDEGVRFDLQLGRKVLAKLMGLDKRFYWQDVVQSKEEEEADVAAFRDAFKEWDWTLQD